MVCALHHLVSETPRHHKPLGMGKSRFPPGPSVDREERLREPPWDRDPQP